MTGAEAREQIVRHLMALSGRRPGMDALVRDLEQTDFFEQPASTQFHGNFPGGLAIHSLEVLRQAVNLMDAWPRTVDADSVVVCALLHDVCKIGAYKTEKRNRKNGEGEWEQYDYWTYADNPFPYGHGEKSVMWITRHIVLSEDEMLAIRWHMGAWEECSARDLSLAMERPLVLLIHTADMVASKLVEEVRR